MQQNNIQADINEQKVLSEQVRLVYQQFTAAAIATLVGAVLLVLSQWSITDHDSLLGWLLAIIIVTIFRVSFALYYRHSSYDIHESKRWGKLFIFGTMCIGLTWGVGLVLLFPTGNLEYQVIIILVLLGMSSGAVTSLSSIREASYAFIIPTLTPVIFFLFIEESQLSNIVSLMVILALVFFIKSTNEVSKNIKENIYLRLSAEEKEKTLKNKSDQLQNIFSKAPLVLWSIDKNGVFTFSDGKSLEYMGLKPGELVGQSAFEFYADYPDVKNSLRRVLAGEAFSEESEVGDRSLENHYIPNFNSLGKPDGCFGIAVDITERKKAELELIKAKNFAENANNIKSDFLSSMSHELRTPLNAILGFAQLIGMDEEDDEKKQNIDEIIHGGKHLLDLINQLLDLSKIESGNVELNIESHSFHKILKNTLAMTRPLVNKFAIQLDDKTRSLPDINIAVDEMRFKQVLLNILSNAIKYNSENGNIIIDGSSNAENMFCLSITDTGAGLTPEQLNKLFEPFERFGAENSHIEGTGLGLPIAKNLIELMGGTITVESELGKGSQFIIQVPLS